jgi:hypothetical protein
MTTSSDTGARTKPRPFNIILLLTLALCFVALASESVLICLATNDPSSLGAGDAAILTFILGPYVLLAVIAWMARIGRRLAWSAFAVTLLLVTWGLWVSGTHAYHYLTDPDYRKLQAVGVFLMPLGQWFLSFCLGVAVVVYRQIAQSSVGR